MNYKLRLQTEGDGDIMSGTFAEVVKEIEHQIKLGLLQDDEVFEIYNVETSTVEYEFNKKTAIDFVETYKRGQKWA